MEMSLTEDSIQLKRAPFSLRLWNQKYNTEKNEFYSSRVLFRLDKSIFEGIEVGMKIDEITELRPGRGMATVRGGASNLVITDMGFHYLFYENETENRFRLLQTEGDSCEFEWLISNISFVADRTEFPIEKTTFDQLFMVCVTDRNLNGMLEESELVKLTISFE